ncbi:MAG: hypothetical protein R3B07_33995 [Polyangiaceae bacterium]
MLRFSLSRSLRPLLVGAAALTLTPACQPECPSQPTPCAVGGELRVELPLDPEFGAYRLTVEGTDSVRSCLLIAPDLPGEKSWVSAECVGMYVTPVIESSCDSGCTPGPTIDCGSECTTEVTGYSAVIDYAGQLDTLTLTLEDSGGSYAPLEVTPEYQTEYPDGKSCGGSCQRATTSVSLDELLQE